MEGRKKPAVGPPKVAPLPDPTTDASSKDSKPKDKETEKKKEQKPAEPKKITLHLTLEQAVSTAVQRNRWITEKDFWEWFDGIGAVEQRQFRDFIEKKSNPDQARSLVMGKIAAAFRQKHPKPRRRNG